MADAWNVLGLDPRDIALHFGHRDGGELVRTLYGHADENIARERILAACDNVRERTGRAPGAR